MRTPLAIKRVERNLQTYFIKISDNQVHLLRKIPTEGNAQITNNQLDVMIQGKGFLQALDANGDMMYTRDGALQVNQNGDLTTASGYLVQPNINIPINATSVNISKDGVVSATLPGNTQPSQLGQLQVATFINPAGLSSIGNNFYKESLASGTPNVQNPQTNEAGGLLQGALESSNVNTVSELIGMIEAQRTYEMNSKAIKAASGMMQYLNNNV
jgi:flagellar basal-body rod protein FlgG